MTIPTVTGPVPKPATPFEKKIAASPVYTEHVSVAGKLYDIRIVFLREQTEIIKGAKAKITFYRLYISEPSGVRLYSTSGSLWKTTRFLEYFREHTSFLSRRALLKAADQANQEALTEATALYGKRVDS